MYEIELTDRVVIFEGWTDAQNAALYFLSAGKTFRLYRRRKMIAYSPVNTAKIIWLNA